MIRPFTAACMLLAGGSGLYLYQVKHRTHLLDRQIEATLQTTQEARERSGVLRAEWTLLNDPERLAALAARFLPLQTTQPGQFTTMAELDKRLPPVGQPATPAQTTDQPPDAPAAEPASPSAAAAPSPEAPPPVAAASPSAVHAVQPGNLYGSSAPVAKTGATLRVHEPVRPAAARMAEHPHQPHDRSSEAAEESGSALGQARLSRPAAPATAARPTAQYAAGLATPAASVYTPPAQPAAVPGYTPSALGMARTGGVVPFGGPYNYGNGN